MFGTYFYVVFADEEWRMDSDDSIFLRDINITKPEGRWD